MWSSGFRIPGLCEECVTVCVCVRVFLFLCVSSVNRGAAHTPSQFQFLSPKLQWRLEERPRNKPSSVLGPPKPTDLTRGLQRYCDNVAMPGAKYLRCQKAPFEGACGQNVAAD